MSESTSNHRRSTSLTTMPPVMTDSHKGSIEDIQISLAPYIQSYLTQTGRRHSCCSVMLPVAFERAAPRSWFDPRFDSPVLEGQFQASVFPQIRLKFRFALFYILLCSLVWLLYFIFDGGPTHYHLLTGSIGLILIFGLVGMWLTHTDIYRAYTNLISSACAILLCLFSLFLLLFTEDALSPLGHFSICIEIVLLIYTIIPLPLWLCCSITAAYSVCFEVLSFLHQGHYIQEPDVDDLVTAASLSDADKDSSGFVYKIVLIRVLIQLCVHLMGVHILIMTVVRMRGTFMKVGQNLLVRRQLEMEKQLKEKMIHSMMPPKVADLLLKESGSVVKGMSFDQCPPRRATPSDLKSLFRPFHMNSMDNVSILFADIVGFTKMSSTKTAEQLVEILNDLFERFDDLCLMNGCEKISTLGDCYYCVSGCPEPRPDHAICCVEMGLGMIQSIRMFDAQRQEGVKMRVGVHTGTVLCGIVGTKRVKFDVWSNDVTLANRMESSGRPDQVHVSGETCSFLGDSYIIEEGEEVDGHRTYFVLGKKQDLISSITDGLSSLGLPGDGSNLLASSPLDGDHSHPFVHHHHQHHNHHHHHHANDNHETGTGCMSQSATNLSSIHPAVPPASPAGPVSSSLNPSPVSSPRPRIASLSKMTKFLKGKHHQTNHRDMEKPKIIVSTKSMPNGIDSDEGDEDIAAVVIAVVNEKGSKFKSWKMSRLLKKMESGSAPVHGSGGAQNGNGQVTVALAVELDNKDCDSSRKSEEVPCVVEQSSGGGGGYQQLPIVIVTPRPSCHTLEVSGCSVQGGVRSRDREGSKSISVGASGDNNSNLSQNSVFDDIIDVRSYISQSRSDISPFARTGSYRSQCEKASLITEAPSGRPRSSTIAANSIDLNNSRNCGRLLCDGASLCPSATSRKDSGIRSNSRRSSIQQQIMLMNQSAALSTHRVSGYFTSSQSSLSAVAAAVGATSTDPVMALKSNGDVNDLRCVIKETHPDPLAACLQQLRKQSDLQLIRCVRDNARSQRSYLVKPPLLPISLRFKSRQLEQEFRSKAHRFGSESELEGGPPTLATPKYNTYIDIFVSFLIYLATSTSLFLLSPSVYLESYKVWVCIFMAFSTLQLFALFICTKQVCRRVHKFARRSRPLVTESCYDSILRMVSNWYPWHICGAILMSLPVISILSNFAMMDVSKFKIFEFHYGFLMFICVIHFCNFTQLNCWMRNCLALVTSMAFVGIAIGHMLELRNGVGSAVVVVTTPVSVNETQELNPELQQAQFDWFNDYRVEIYVDLVLLLVLVWFLNREFEISYRLSFYGSAVANQDKIRVQSMKNQADMLLHNIIPKHVAEQLKNTAKYSENHKNIGIIFASIVNFNEMYDESYLGGKEYLRVLNELIGDFDELLARPEFRCVEKIKTIGSTFMAASGLDPGSRGEENEHLFTLLDFAIAMQQVVDSFNRDLLEFNLIMRVGYNFGDVTAGVIGTSKLYYDIWGDSVNVASRMDSTGIPGRIQVGSACVPTLSERYDFEPRGKVYVKGKDHMEVYLLVGKKPDLLGPPELDIVPMM